MSRSWAVDVPVVGYVAVVVEAADEEAAIAAALGAAEAVLRRDEESKKLGEIIELAPVRVLAQGNVLYAPLAEIDAQEQS